MILEVGIMVGNGIDLIGATGVVEIIVGVRLGAIEVLLTVLMDAPQEIAVTTKTEMKNNPILFI
jgi:hypothetical protein